MLMHPALEPYVGHRVRLAMSEGRPWYGVVLVGELTRPTKSAPEGTLVLRHKTGGDVILLDGAVQHVREAKVTEK